MNQNDPLTRLQRMTDAEVSKREAARQHNRATHPELAAVIDANPDARLICIHAHDGTLLLGKAPAPEFALSAGFLCFATTYGWKKR